jgi:hypothetical protein
MRTLANIFLVLFCADGVVSLADQLYSLGAKAPVPSEIRIILAEIVMLVGFIVYQALGIDKRLPKKLFLPLMIFLCLVPILPWIFPSLLFNSAYGITASLLQILLCLWPVYQLNGVLNPKAGFLLPKSMFEGPFFSLRNTVLFTGANFVILPVVSAMLLLSSANAFMYKNTGGFMRLGTDGVYMAEKVYRRDNRTVQLVGMIHMGEEHYYEELAKLAPPGRTIILAEGVTDNKNLLPNRLDYGNVADYLGLTLQQEKMQFQGKVIDAKELEQPRTDATAGQKGPIHILRADVDVSSFRPQTISFLDDVGREMKRNSSLTQGLVSSGSWSSKYANAEVQQIIMQDILERRNEEVIRNLRKAIGRYDAIVIPWGALHMPQIEAEVVSQGYELQQVRERMSMDFSKFIKAKYE